MPTLGIVHLQHNLKLVFKKRLNRHRKITLFETRLRSCQMAAVNHISASKGTVAENGLAFVEALKVKFARYRVYRETISELSSLSNRELADLGLNRSMIKRLALQAAYENA